MLELDKQDIHLWLAREPDASSPQLWQSYLKLLSERELARYERLAKDEMKRQFVLTQVLARSVLAKYLGNAPPESLRFQRNAHGKPYLDTDGAPQFNLTNSHGLVVLAVAAEAEVGVDVEYIRRDVPFLKLARRWFTPDEAASFDGLAGEDLRQHFFDYWTLKEGWLKGYGTGLKTPLATFSIKLQPDSIKVDFDEKLGEIPEHWSFWQFDVAGDFRLSLCARDHKVRKDRVMVREGLPLEGFRELSLVQRRPVLR